MTLIHSSRKTFTTIYILFAASVLCNADGNELVRLKQSWRTARPVFEKLKSQPRRYRDAVSSRNILGQVRTAGALAKGAKAPGTDTIRVLVLKVQFVPDSDTNTTGDGTFDYAGNGQPVYTNGDPHQGHNLDHEPPHDSLYIRNQMLALRNYYWAASSGRLWIEYEQWPKGDRAAYDLPHQMSFYSDFYNQQQNWGAGIYTLLRDAAAAADADSCAFSYWAGGVKVPKAVMLIHAGSVWQTDPWGADLPAVFIAMDESSPIIVRAGADTIHEASINAETQSQDGMVLGSQGEIAHEFGHQLGLPDLYDVEFNSVGLGEWELMSHGSWNLNAYVPPHLSAWAKEYLGWIDPIELKPGDNVQQTFKWSAKNPGAVVKIPLNSHEYYLVENRRAWSNPDNQVDYSDSLVYGPGSDSSGARVWRNGVLVRVDDYDLSLPFELNAGGLLVWHVDDSLVAQRWATNTLEVGDVKAVHLVEADHIQDLQRWGGSPYSTYASPHDAYYAGNNDRLDDGSDPATLANDGSSSHVAIYNVSAPAESMSARVRVGLWELGCPLLMAAAADWNSPVHACTDSGDIILLPDIYGKLYAWRYQYDSTTQRSSWAGLYNKDTTLVLSPTDTIKVYGEFAKLPGNIFSSPAVGDVDRDSQPEVFIAIASSQTEGAVYGFKTIPLYMQDTSAQGHVYTVRRATPLAGWPKVIAGPIYSSVTLGDIDNDDTLEVIVAGDDRTLHVWSHDGTPLDSFPRDLTMETRSTAAVADIDPAYPGNEIVILSGDSRVFAFHGDGTTVPGFPALTPWVDWVSSSVAIADVNRDRRLEIVACNKKGIYVIDGRGNVLPGWPVLHDQVAISSPAIGDIDGNGYPDITVAIGKNLYAYNYNGTLMTGFPVVISCADAVQSSPVLADIDGDRKQDIIIGSPDGSLYCVSDGGKIKSGYPITMGGPVKSSPVHFRPSGIPGARGKYTAVGSDDGKLSIWWSGDHDVPASWPAFHRDQTRGGADATLLSPVTASREGGLLQNLYVYPNPARTAPVRIRYYLNEAARVDFKVFNVAGDLVREFSQDGQAAVDNEYVWDLENIATGLYFVRASAAGAGGSGYKLCKIAVVK